MTAVIEVEGAQIEFARWGGGGGPPILLLHEGLGSVALWRDFPLSLANTTGKEVLAWSRRGHGWSAPFAQAHDFDFMHREADEAFSLLDALGVAKAHLFGHSDGGSIGLLMAARRPDRVASLVLEAPHIFVEEICTRQIVALGRAVRGSDMIERMGRYQRDPAAVFRQWHAIWIDPLFANWSIEDEIAGIAVPTLLIQGNDDEYGTFEQLERIAAQVPQARQLRLAECRHSPHRDQPEAVLAAVSAFLGESLDVAL